MTVLVRYWFKFEVEIPTDRVAIDNRPPEGIGVTAHDIEDAISLLKQQVFVCWPMPEKYEVIEDVDVSSLELPSGITRPPVRRGVWYPPFR